MRNSLLPGGLPEINYGIRQIVAKGQEREMHGYPVIWENIGDPVQKGVQIPGWIKEIISRHIQDNGSFGYCDSKGLAGTREFLAERTNDFNGHQITPDDITFFNGLGDAIARFYSLLSDEVRVLMPSPTYPAHTGAEKLRIGEEPVTYSLRPENNWMPDPDEVRSVVERHPGISCLLVINPDNPTGAVYSEKVLRELVQIAREYDLFILADEIYENLVYNGRMVRLAEVIEEVPALVMKGISKEIPWPGSRCGWIEYYNRQSDAEFNKLCERIDQCKMTEVCSTTLPQKVIPEILGHERYQSFLDQRTKGLSHKMGLLKSRIEWLDDVDCVGAGGAFYATLHINRAFSSADIDSDLLTGVQQELFMRWKSEGEVAPDLCLVHYLLAGTGVCSVPLSGFNTTIRGIRITLLEQNGEHFEYMLDQLLFGLGSVFSRKNSLIQTG